VPDDAVRVDLASGTAEMHVESIEVLDQYNFPSSISGGPKEPATVSFDVYWHTPVAVEHLRDETQGFAATLLDVTSTISFTARTADFAYASDGPDPATSIFARIGYSANGVFMPPEGVPEVATPVS